ncbi:MAG: hypothetical protein LBT39_02020 [Treponema sp.]|jgi:hypothetical protein|nr:hypothetical protein [Treponema sp.]
MKGTMAEMNGSLLRLLPPVLRARDFRLYTQGGGRLVDLWQDGGRAILGHTPAGVLRELKNSANRGLFAPLPHPQEQRLARALAQLLPNRAFRFFADRSALDKAGYTGPFPDPAFGDSAAGDSTGPVSLWRPFLDAPPAPILIPVLPWPLAPWVLAVDKALDKDLAPSDPISPALLAAATRGIYDLIAATERPVYPKINQVLYGSPQTQWHCRGIYLTYSPPAKDDTWETLFRRFLEGGFLIPPSAQEPLILPSVLSPGEETKLAALLRACISFPA